MDLGSMNLSNLIKDCCVLTQSAAKRYTAVHSPSNLPLWDGGQKQESEACELG